MVPALSDTQASGNPLPPQQGGWQPAAGAGDGEQTSPASDGHLGGHGLPPRSPPAHTHPGDHSPLCSSWHAHHSMPREHHHVGVSGAPPRAPPTPHPRGHHHTNHPCAPSPPASPPTPRPRTTSTTHVEPPAVILDVLQSSGPRLDSPQLRVQNPPFASVIRIKRMLRQTTPRICK